MSLLLVFKLEKQWSLDLFWKYKKNFHFLSVNYKTIINVTVFKEYFIGVTDTGFVGVFLNFTYDANCKVKLLAHRGAL